MVYLGRPSRACATCKARKIKCDEAEPSCTQCKKTSRSCPGYIDVMFRNQTEAVTKKQQSRKSKSTGKSKQRLASSRPEHDEETDASSASGNSSQDPMSCSPNVSLSNDTPANEASTQLVITRKDSPASTQMSHALLAQLYQLKAYSSSTSIRPPPWLSIQEQAVHICFKNFDQLYGGTYDAHNLLLSLAPLYQASPEGSPLRVATHAAALCAVSQLPSKRTLQPEAARTYGKAVRTMAAALKYPEVAQSNETLLATLLLSWYETLSATNRTMHAWSNHIEGATALVRMRGSTQFHDPLGLSLFRAIRTEIFTNCLRTGKAPVDFPEVGGWLSDTCVGTYDYRDPVANLMHFAVELPGLKWKQKELERQGRDASTMLAMETLIRMAHKLTTQMEESDLPDEWRPHTVGYVQELPDRIDNAKAWVGPVHGYEDVYVASALNKLRCCRALTAEIIIDGLAWAYPDDYQSRQDYRHAVYVEQTAIDEICSSVPSHFDWSQQSNDQNCDNETMHTADIIGGYLLHWPLRVARGSPRISSYQRAWLGYQLDDIAERCGVHQARLCAEDTPCSGKCGGPTETLTDEQYHRDNHVI